MPTYPLFVCGGPHQQGEVRDRIQHGFYALFCLFVLLLFFLGYDMTTNFDSFEVQAFFKCSHVLFVGYNRTPSMSMGPPPMDRLYNTSHFHCHKGIFFLGLSVWQTDHLHDGTRTSYRSFFLLEYEDCEVIKCTFYQASC